MSQYKVNVFSALSASKMLLCWQVGGKLWHCLLWCGQPWQAGYPSSWLPHPSSRVITWPAATCLCSHCQRIGNEKDWESSRRHGDPPQTMSSDPTINIDVITCLVRLVAQSWNPSCFMFSDSSTLAIQCLLFLLSVLISCYWLSLAHEQSCLVFLIQSALSIVMWKRGVQTYCVHKAVILNNNPHSHLSLPISIQWNPGSVISVNKPLINHVHDCA